jgi:hypothetical protein
MTTNNSLFSTVHVTKAAKDGKLKEINSVNVSTIHNEFCKSMKQQNDLSCSSCYAWRYESMRPTLSAKLQFNADLLSQSLLDFQLPRFNARFVRFNSFGELVNVQHFINLIRICELNPHTNFTLWTKRLDIINKAFDCNIVTRPNNLKLIYSSVNLNKKVDLPRHFDKVFTVYSRDYAKENATNINCGALKCIDCLTCYTENSVQYMNELKK